MSVPSLVFWPYARMSLVCIVLLLGIGVAPLFPTVSRETGFAVAMVLLKLTADAITYGLERQPRSNG